MRGPRVVAVLLLVAGCPAIYDAQYNDRKTALEQSRTEFLSGDAQIQFLSTGEDRVFWIDSPQTIEHAQLHSVDTRDGTQVDYAIEVGNGETNVDAVGDKLFVECIDGVAFDATVAGSATTPFAQLDTGSVPCDVVGDDVYLVLDGQLVKWTPTQGPATTTIVDFASVGIANTRSGGFGFADPQHLLFQEGVNVWLVPIGGGSATLLDTPDTGVGNGTVAFDGEGVVYTSADGVQRYIRYDSPGQVQTVSDLIANGGYSLNFEHGDVQDIYTTPANYTMFDGHLIYEGYSGIFALGFDTGVVTDILLDGLPDSDGGNTAPQYLDPVVTTNGSLFVQDEAVSDVQPVYRVDISDRLK